MSHGADLGGAGAEAAPATPRGLPYRGGTENPSAAALRAAFGPAILRSGVCWGETSVVVAPDRIHAVIAWLRDDPGQRYEYLVDVTAVEYREPWRPLEVVWHLRSLSQRRFLRLKVELPRHGTLEVPSVTDLYAGADWLERECYDMFGVRFTGHPDLRRILLWDGYREGHPLRKDFPLRGRFSRSEQLAQALAASPDGTHAMDAPAEALPALPALPRDIQARLAPAAPLRLPVPDAPAAEDR